VRKIIHDAFDFGTMARASLGDHWTTLSPEQRQEFVERFRDLFERSYDRLVLRFLGESETKYGAETIEGDRAVVRTTLLRKQGDELPVDYRLVSDGRRWAMSDVVVDGVSLAANFHSQFEKTIRTSSYEALLRKIRDKLAQE
jgi:phospholipid transport system substrate-binding protein